MEIIIDIDDPLPLFTQLVAQFKQAVASKQIAPGDALPSIRQLANDLDINNKTVAKAYKLLERDSIIQAKGYRGTFVHPEAVDNCELDLTSWINKKLGNAIEILKAGNVTDSEIRITFAELMNSKHK